MMMRALALLALAAAPSLAVGPTFGAGLAGTPVCAAPLTILNYSLPPLATHGVLHHFWVTGAQYKVDRMHISYFVDGEAEPSVSFQPSMACGLAFPTEVAHDFEYSAGGLCGKTAPVGGWSHVFPIPFYKSVIVTARGDASDAGCFTAYLNVRGTVELPLAVPGTGQALPFGTRMVLATQPLALRQPLEFVPLFSFPAGTRGQVFQTSWGVEAQPSGGPAAGGGYIEGCWNFYADVLTPYPGLVAGTGVEDYFDSGYYFGADSGDAVGVQFFNTLSGLPLFQRADPYERLSAFRFHNTDPLVFTDGGSLTWQVGSQGSPGHFKCGNRVPDGYEVEVDAGARAGRVLSAVNVTTSAWVFLFPTVTPPRPPPSDVGCADATCDAFCDVVGVAGCEATWAGVPSMRAPRTGAACGGTSGLCAAPADACAPGWSICLANATAIVPALAALRSRMSAEQCAIDGGPVPRRFAAGMSHAVQPCPSAPVTADNGCTTGLYGSEPVCCGAACAVPSCPNSVWQGATRIHANEADGCAAMPASAVDGVLCCKI